MFGLGLIVLLLVPLAVNRLWVFADSYRLWNDAACHCRSSEWQAPTGSISIAVRLRQGLTNWMRRSPIFSAQRTSARNTRRSVSSSVGHTP